MLICMTCRYLSAADARKLMRAGWREMMMKQLVYRSQPFGFDEAMLAGILSGARRNNARDDITGALICREDLYLQLLEGSEAAIDAVYARIAVDDRHGDVRLLLVDEIGQRMFPHWAMLDDRSPSLMWSPADVAAGAIEAASRSDLLELFARLALVANAEMGSRAKE